MATVNKVNDKGIIKNKVIPSYYHCFKLNDASYALFDSKMDVPIIISSLSVIQSTKLPQNSFVFYYEINLRFFFEKNPKTYLTMNKDANGKHQKPPLRYHYIDKKNIFYHVFKLNSILYSIFGVEYDMPLAHGDFSKIQNIMNHINEDAVIFYYKEDTTIKNSFKVWYIYKNKKIRYVTGR